MGKKSKNQDKANKAKFCPPKKSLPKKNENSIATQNRGRIWPYWPYLKSIKIKSYTNITIINNQ
jgi:hypothetical protein